MPQFQSEFWCTNELRILMQIKTISLTIVKHQDSLRNRGKQQLRNGPLTPNNTSIIFTRRFWWEIKKSDFSVFKVTFPEFFFVKIYFTAHRLKVYKNKNKIERDAQIYLYRDLKQNCMVPSNSHRSLSPPHDKMSFYPLLLFWLS